MSACFQLISVSSKSQARRGVITTAHGILPTPFFMPIATKGVVKTLTAREVGALGANILLSNTYHLMLRPGLEIIKTLGGLHALMDWPGAILTDSGGYQVFSLAHARKLSEEGALFRSHIDGSQHLLTPEHSVELQLAIGSDLIMVLDECAPYPADTQYLIESLTRTTRWASRARKYLDAHRGDGPTKSPLLFGIVQGGTLPELRQRSAEELLAIGFDGYAVGGLSVGEPRELTLPLVELHHKMIPENYPRYFMGAGRPEEIVSFVRRGIDMFDCVLPTRNARHGTAYIRTGLALSENDDFYQVVHITNERHKASRQSLDQNCDCLTCRSFNCGYLHHLFSINETLGARLLSTHNIRFYLKLMEDIRASIELGTL